MYPTNTGSVWSGLWEMERVGAGELYAARNLSNLLPAEGLARMLAPVAAAGYVAAGSAAPDVAAALRSVLDPSVARYFR